MVTATDLRSAVAGLVTLANRDLTALWRQVSTAVQAREALKDILPGIVDVYGSAAAVVAADWYDEQRLKFGVAGRFAAIPADLGDVGADALAGWGVSPLFQQTPDFTAAEVLIAGGLQRRIANAARDTIVGSSITDPRADGWQRVGNGSCAFCRMLIGRGAVYSEAGADFASHDHCNCSAVPAFKGQPRPVKPYTPSTAGVTARDRARARRWMAEHDV